MDRPTGAFWMPNKPHGTGYLAGAVEASRRDVEALIKMGAPYV
jgi:hypothetical protein